MSNGYRWRTIGPAGKHGRWLTLGCGNDVVFLASPVACGECYLPTIRRLARFCRAHLLEMPGSGWAMHLHSPWSVIDYTNWAAEAIGELGLSSCSVIGQSYSGMVAVSLAASFPSLVSALVVADSPGFGEPTSLWRGIRGAVSDAVIDLRLTIGQGPRVVSNAVNHRRNFWALIEESVRADLTDLARMITAPTLVAWGGMSRLLRPIAARRLAATLPRSSLYISPHGGHAWVVSQPDEFARAAAPFLEKVSGTFVGQRRGSTSRKLAETPGDRRREACPGLI